ncbi:MAG TPA: hypothetical protein VGO93_28315, partial [Candidatus Xenobia bacterium]
MSSVQAAGAKFVSHQGKGSFGTVVGEFDHEVTLHGGHGEPHARLDLKVGGQMMEADINVHSTENPDGSKGGSEVQYAVREQTVSSLPKDGLSNSDPESYVKDGLKPADFQTVGDDDLHQKLVALAKSSKRVELSGQIYHDGKGSGIHDIHMNSGDPSRPTEPDGIARFYTPNSNGTFTEES